MARSRADRQLCAGARVIPTRLWRVLPRPAWGLPSATTERGTLQYAFIQMAFTKSDGIRAAGRLDGPAAGAHHCPQVAASTDLADRCSVPLHLLAECASHRDIIANGCIRRSFRHQCMLPTPLVQRKASRRAERQIRALDALLPGTTTPTATHTPLERHSRSWGCLRRSTSAAMRAPRRC